MKAILEFNLPEEEVEFEEASKGNRFKRSLEDYDNYLRDQIKHNDNLSSEELLLLQGVRAELYDIMQSYSVNIYD